MKANELMIGDWVSTPKGNYQIDCIQDNDVVGTTYNNGEGVESLFHINKIEPIPLTPEILKKNRWVYIAEDKVFYPENLKGELPWIYYITDGSNEVFRMQDFCNLQYVHQLQHALRLCLIEKTIEL